MSPNSEHYSTSTIWNNPTHARQHWNKHSKQARGTLLHAARCLEATGGIQGFPFRRSFGENSHSTLLISLNTRAPTQHTNHFIHTVKSAHTFLLTRSFSWWSAHRPRLRLEPRHKVAYCFSSPSDFFFRPSSPTNLTTFTFPNA